MEIILATHNQDKLKEISAMLKLPGIKLRSMSEAGITADVAETGTSYSENALIKARYAHAQLGGLVLADDSGLSIDLLDGYPGIYSARFAGEHASYPEKIQHIWHLLAAYPQERWTAAFHCALAFIDDQKKEHVFSGECRGKIISEMRGENGFGYDPVFYMDEYQMTTGEMDPELKNLISHRALAFAKFNDFLHEQFSGGL
ncbi:MAG TPA: RdgB/HAM1 family non-canonical purine NTP pyrophosphatase [Clostridiaceae bacterium]|nr:RdgB/HAM1 family non-canonical purine NTP pyrophosphatase [Clostridiaceae bacterium]